MTVNELIDKLEEIKLNHQDYELRVYVGYSDENPIHNKDNILDIFSITNSDREDNNGCYIRIG